MNNRNGQTRPLVSICIPVLNEAENIVPLLERLDLLKSKLSNTCDIEIIFTDNASTDNTWSVIQEHKGKYKNLRGYRFTKNIGFQNSILFNFRQALGDAVIQLDADLQDPPELIEDFVNFWLDGYKVVTGVRESREESKMLSIFRNTGYFLIDKLSDHPIKRNAGDFRLLDRKVVNSIIQTKVPEPYIRGMISKRGYHEKDIFYARTNRKYGESKFNIKSLLRLGANGLANHSNLPLKIANFIGGATLIFSFLGFIYYVSLKFFQPDLPRGFASMYALITFGIGVNTLLLSLIGSYIRKIYLIVADEDQFIIDDEI